MSEPFPDVIQDLWQPSHLTVSYVGRAAAGAILLATGILDDNPVAIVVAALFLPFLAEVLAISFGLWSRDRRLILRQNGNRAGRLTPPTPFRPLSRRSGCVPAEPL
jgi:hypothetical protein